ncbi:MAG TPA: redoxin domain-containing protein [Terriglobales bacterium]|jgi:peroxiredoxin Q/BCP|nr:redoxin domain-containing protein [Terriglobales bacterium]
MFYQTETLKLTSRAPEFALESAKNDRLVHTLSGFLRRGTLVLEFLRGTWCPNCRLRLAEVEQVREQVHRAGAELAFIAAEKRDGVFRPDKFLEKQPISFPFLLDEDRSVTKAYGLYHRLGIDAWNIAHPATVIVDQQRIIRFIYRGEDQSDRAPLANVMEALRGLPRIP